MGWNPHGGGGGSGTIKKIASKNTARLSVTHPTGPTVTLTPKVATAVAVNPQGQWRSTAWYGPVQSNTGVTLTKNALYFVPLNLPTAMTVKKLAIKVYTAVASTTVRLGVYKDNGHGKPGARVSDLGTVATTTTGAKTLSAATLALVAGNYWLCAVQQTTGTGVSLNHITQGGGAGAVTVFVAAAFATSTGSVRDYGWKSTASTFTGALPATAPAVAGATGTTGAPLVRVQSA